MPFIRVIGEDDADGDLFKIYDEIQRTRGRISNVMRIQSLDPKGMKAHLEMYMALVYGKGPLSRLRREVLACVVSKENGCDYCVEHHREALLKYAKDDAWVAQVCKDVSKAKLNAQDRALVDYALGLTREPGKGRREAVDALRKAGFDDESILQATEITSYFNFVNRMVHALGVEMESEGHTDYHY